MVHSYDANRFNNNQLLTDYIEKNLSGKDAVMDEQINAFKAYWLIMAVFHEIKSGRSISEGRKHISAKIKETKVLKGIHLHGLSKTAKGFLILLNLHLYTLALIGAKVVNRKRN